MISRPIEKLLVCLACLLGNGLHCSDVDYCTEEYDLCEEEHVASCVDGKGGINNVTCQCKLGWHGNQCDVMIQHCKETRCDAQG